jgi:hypothetical protein
MTTHRLRLHRMALVILCTASMSIPAVAQLRSGGGATIDRGVVNRPAFSFYWETHLDPAAPPLNESFATATIELGTDTVQRVILDRAERVYFGYNIRVDGLPADMFRVTLQPLTMSNDLERVLGGDAASWKTLPRPELRAPLTIRSGDVIALTLLTNTTGRSDQRVMDYFTVREPFQATFDAAEPPTFSFAGGTPRDLKLDDVELRLDRPGVVALGREGAVRDTGAGSPFLRSADDVSGAVVWVYVPKRGRYLLSLSPRQQSGFVKGGEVRGSGLRFRMGDELINIVARSRIAPGKAAFNLYVLRQPAWKPTYPNANLDTIHIGAADAAEFLAGK